MFTRRENHYATKVIFEANEGEHLYGLGQETEDAFDRKGSTCNLIHYNTKSTIPFLYSSLGYGFFWNNPSPGRCETTRNHTLWNSDIGGFLCGDTRSEDFRELIVRWFQFGLFSPIMRLHGSGLRTPEQPERSVYLPEGNWIRVPDNRFYTGKQTVRVHAELDQYIAFVKEGSDVLGAFE